ncbi:hypothetical protein [Acinetobacter sp. ANC 4805]|uniref:hypothetical protein n=1 Tax=Acinetobacter sp. ANC 4805 TaxID=2923425 RepID=UPI001F4A3758|nr:hypothetical protein [Acinetobacter sp. ANC 4805]MCH7310193.1 hypothetical protein [Acinetobacter sp. ANC 4805]
MKKLSKLTRLPFIPEMNQDSVLCTIIFLISFPLASLFLSLEKKNLFFLMLLAYYLISIYAPRLMIAKDLIFRNFIEFRGEITEFFPSEHSNYSTEIKINTQEKINQDLSQHFLMITPNEIRRTYFYQRLFSSQIHKFLLDDFVNQPIIFRSFQHSAFIFDLGLTVKAQSGHEIHFFYKQLEYRDQYNLNKILKYKDIHKVQHHFDFIKKVHHFKLKFRKGEVLIDCDKNKFIAINQILATSDIHFI